MIQQYNKSRLNHAGITLIELLLVIAILSIAVGIASVSISLVFSRDSEGCAKTIDGALGTTRMNSMAQEGVLTMTIDTTARMVTVDSTIKGRLLEKTIPTRVSVSFEEKGGVVDLSSNTQLVVEFDKSTGKVKTITTDGGAAVDGTVCRIHCVSENGKTVTVILVKATGKHYVEYE